MNGFTVNLFGEVSEGTWVEFMAFLESGGLHAAGSSESCWVESCEDHRPLGTPVTEEDRRKIAVWLRDAKDVARYEVCPIISPDDILDQSMREVN